MKEARYSTPNNAISSTNTGLTRQWVDALNLPTHTHTHAHTYVKGRGAMGGWERSHGGRISDSGVNEWLCGGGTLVAAWGCVTGALSPACLRFPEAPALEQEARPL